MLTECGLTIGYSDGKPLCRLKQEDSGNFVYDVDTHFVHLTRDDWFLFSYGAKLWRATASDDPELQKLVRLSERLQPDEEE